MTESRPPTMMETYFLCQRIVGVVQGEVGKAVIVAATAETANVPGGAAVQEILAGAWLSGTGFGCRYNLLGVSCYGTRTLAMPRHPSIKRKCQNQIAPPRRCPFILPRHSCR